VIRVRVRVRVSVRIRVRSKVRYIGIVVQDKPARKRSSHVNHRVANDSGVIDTRMRAPEKYI
jgi:hypothetical protein